MLISTFFAFCFACRVAEAVGDTDRTDAL